MRKEYTALHSVPRMAPQPRDGTTSKGASSAGCPGRLVHGLRRTAVREMVSAGTLQSVVMSISGRKTNAMFLRYNITSDRDQVQALLRQSYSAQQITVEPYKENTVQPGTRVQ